MAPFGAFFARVFGMVATDAMVNALAHNKSFQRLALRIDSFLSTHQKKGEEITKAGEQLLRDPQLKIKMQKQAAEAAEELKQRASASTSSAGRFFQALKQEIEKDLGGGKK